MDLFRTEQKELSYGCSFSEAWCEIYEIMTTQEMPELSALSFIAECLQLFSVKVL